jgi:rRNA maturation endonuclease Nob1
MTVDIFGCLQPTETDAILNNLTPKDPMARWIKHRPEVEYEYICSNCQRISRERTRYCSNCGIKMSN